MRRGEARRAVRAHLEGVRPCYLGFGLFWAVSFAASFTPAPLLASQSATHVHALAASAGMALAVLVAGIVAALRGRNGSPARASHPAVGVAIAAGLVGLDLVLDALPASAVLGVLAPLASPAIAAILGLASSVGSVGFLLAQQGVLAAIGPGRAATVGSASAALSALGCVTILAIPPGVARLLVETIVLACATVLQIRSLHAVAGRAPADARTTLANPSAASPSPEGSRTPPPSSPSTVGLPLTAEARPAEGSRTWRQALGELWRPALCVAIFALVWKLSTRMVPDDTAALATTLTLIAFGLATLLLCVHSLLSRGHASLLRVYRLLFPIMTGAFLLLPVLGITYGPLLSALLMLGFELVNLLLICLCAQVAHELRLPSSAVYALGLGPAYVAMFAGQALGLSLESAVQAQSLVHLSDISLGAVYLLSIVLLLITRSGRRGEPEGTGEGAPAAPAAPAALAGLANPARPLSAAAPSQTQPLAGVGADARAGTPGSNQAAQAGAGVGAPPSHPSLAILAADAGLTPRELDIAAMVARGNSVPAIAERLSISQNTVRGHTKHIYAKLGIHTKQELVDLVAQQEGEGTDARATTAFPAPTKGPEQP